MRRKELVKVREEVAGCLLLCLGSLLDLVHL